MQNFLFKKVLVIGTAVFIVFSSISVANPIVTNIAENIVITDDKTSFFASMYNLSKYWGNADMKLTEGKGFFDTYKDENDKWWLVTPNGHAFYSVGANCVGPGNGSVDDTKIRLKDWGFNTLGAWSKYDIVTEVPYTHTFIFRKKGRIGWETYVLKNGTESGKKVPDVFDSYWWNIVEENVTTMAEKLKDDPYLIGYWLDNEISWGSDPVDKNTLLETYLSVPYEFEQPGKMKAVEFLIDRYEDDGIEVFNKVWNMDLRNFNELYNKTKLGRTGWIAQHFIPRVKDDIQDFAQLVAHIYFENITNILRSHDPNHLVLGVRFHLYGAPDVVIRECGKYCNVTSVNYYRKLPAIYDPMNYLRSKILGLVTLEKWMKKYHELSDKPLIIGEFNCIIMDFPLLRSFSKVTRSVHTQKERANYFERYARNCLKTPYVIGYHWHHYFDNDEYIIGLVDIYNNPYDVLVNRMSHINNKIYELHGS